MSKVSFDINTLITTRDGISLNEIGVILQNFTSRFLYIKNDKLYSVEKVEQLKPDHRLIGYDDGFQLMSSDMRTMLHCFRRELAEHLNNPDKFKNYNTITDVFVSGTTRRPVSECLPKAFSNRSEQVCSFAPPSEVKANVPQGANTITVTTTEVSELANLFNSNIDDVKSKKEDGANKKTNCTTTSKKDTSKKDRKKPGMYNGPRSITRETGCIDQETISVVAKKVSVKPSKKTVPKPTNKVTKKSVSLPPQPPLVSTSDEEEIEVKITDKTVYDETDDEESVTDICLQSRRNHTEALIDAIRHKRGISAVSPKPGIFPDSPNLAKKNPETDKGKEEADEPSPSTSKTEICLPIIKSPIVTRNLEDNNNSEDADDVHSIVSKILREKCPETVDLPDGLCNRFCVPLTEKCKKENNDGDGDGDGDGNEYEDDKDGENEICDGNEDEDEDEYRDVLPIRIPNIPQIYEENVSIRDLPENLRDSIINTVLGMTETVSPIGILMYNGATLNVSVDKNNLLSVYDRDTVLTVPRLLPSRFEGSLSHSPSSLPIAQFTVHHLAYHLELVSGFLLKEISIATGSLIQDTLNALFKYCSGRDILKEIEFLFVNRKTLTLAQTEFTTDIDGNVGILVTFLRDRDSTEEPEKFTSLVASGGHTILYHLSDLVKSKKTENTDEKTDEKTEKTENTDEVMEDLKKYLG